MGILRHRMGASTPKTSAGGGGITTVNGWQGGEVADGAGTASFTISPSADDLIVLIEVGDNALSGLNPPAGFTVENDITDSPVRVRTSYLIATGSETDVTIDDQSNHDFLWFVKVYRGVNTITPFEAFPTSESGTGTTGTHPEITGVDAGGVVIAISTLDDQEEEPSTTDSNYTDRVSASTSASSTKSSATVADRLLAAGGSETPGDTTWPTSDGWRGVTAALIPA